MFVFVSRVLAPAPGSAAASRSAVQLLRAVACADQPHTHRKPAACAKPADRRTRFGGQETHRQHELLHALRRASGTCHPNASHPATAPPTPKKAESTPFLGHNVGHSDRLSGPTRKFDFSACAAYTCAHLSSSFFAFHSPLRRRFYDQERNRSIDL